MARDEIDDTRVFEAEHTAGPLPWGWLALFWGLIVWGAYYAWTYTPPRWSQAADYEATGGAASAGTNIFATVFFTVLATTVAVVLLVSVSRRPRAKTDPRG